MNVRRFVSGLLILAALGVAWQFLFSRDSRQPQQVFRESLASMERGELPDLARAREVLEGDPGSEDRLRVLDAAVAVHNNRPDEALSRIAAVKPTDDVRRPSMLYAARALHQINRLVEAESLLQALTRENPADAEVKRWLGIVLYDLGAFDAATPVLTELAALEPEDYRPYRLLGLMYLDFEEYSKAIPAYLNALQRNPPRAARDDIQLELGRALIADRQYAEALEVLQSVTRSAKSEGLIARCHFSLGQLELAQTHLDNGLKIDPNERESRLLAAELLESEQKLDEAHAVLHKLVQDSPYDITARYRFALLLQRQRRTEEAEKELATWTMLQKSMTRLVELNQAAVTRPRDAAVRDELAEVCESLGKTELAAMWRKAAMACRVEPNAAPGAFSGVK